MSFCFERLFVIFPRKLFASIKKVSDDKINFFEADFPETFVLIASQSG
jgi:hypothetical protein